MEKYYIEIAKEIAKVAHAGQLDKGGNPYISHPEFVADHLDTVEEKIVGWLHDVLEDTDFNRDVLLKLFGQEIMDSLECVTRRPDESWWNYIGRVATNPIAIRVKMADLIHNMDLSRIKDRELDEVDFRRVKRYQETYNWLAEKIAEFPK